MTPTEACEFCGAQLQLYRFGRLDCPLCPVCDREHADELERADGALDVVDQELRAMAGKPGRTLAPRDARAAVAAAAADCPLTTRR